ncbi:MAG: prepilin peptidase [Bdellovibrionales bacterium]
MESFIIGPILGISFLDDLLTRKVHNVLILSFLTVTALFYAMFPEQIIWLNILKSTGLVIATITPLVYFRIIGAGDWKLFLVLGLSLAPDLMWQVILYSFVWNLAAGILKLVVAYLSSKSKEERHNGLKEALAFPFTFGILMAWLTQTGILGGFF